MFGILCGYNNALVSKRSPISRRKKMRETVLVIMAAGIGSRFGGGIKQLEPVGPNGEIIMSCPAFGIPVPTQTLWI